MASADWNEERKKQVESQVHRILESHDQMRQLSELEAQTILAGIERWYSAAEAARFFSRTSAWIYDRFSKKKFTHRDSTPITPVMVGDGPKPRMRFNLELIREIANSMYRDGTVKMEEYKVILTRIANAQFQEVLLDPEEVE
jgi:hypothetical protein